MKNLSELITSDRKNIRGLFCRHIVFASFVLMLLFSGQISAQQPAIIGATTASNQAVVFPDANVPGTQALVPGLPAGARPHGVAYFGSDNALLSDFLNSRVFVVQISTATLISTINTAPTYDGTGTIAVAPNLSAALAMGGTTTLNVIQGPFGAGSTISQVTLPGVIAGYQTQAIVFNNAGRAFVHHTTGISVLDAPYTSIAFTIPVTGNVASGAIAISPDGNTLLATDLTGNLVRIYQGPFTAASTFTTLAVPGGVNLDGIMVAPNGANAIVVSASAHHAAAISAPFSSSSTVQTIPLPAGTGGFEDVGISADSQIAILAGNSTSEPPVFIRAPFGATSVTSYVPLQTGANTARGNGAVRFLPPGLAPGLTVSKSAAPTVPSGSNLTYTISYGNTGSIAASNVVIRDPLPVGTTFVSATNGGTLVAGNVVFNIGTVNAGTINQTVSFTVTVNTANGGTVENNNYTIEGDGVSPIPGPPVTTSVTAPVCQTILLSPATLADGTVGASYSQTISASGGGAPYSYSVSGGALPNGLLLDSSTGEIAGTPTSEGTSNFTVTATDVNDCTGSRTYSITVNQPAEFNCPHSQGYWKNNPDAWPVDSLTLGSQNYTNVELLRILQTPVGSGRGGGGDASLILAHQLIAAKLNIANGSDPAPVSGVITNADFLLSAYSGKLPYSIKPSTVAGQAMTASATVLDSYNNGLLTPVCIP